MEGLRVKVTPEAHPSGSAEVYRDLATALRERLAVIADRAAYERDPAAHLEQLKGASERISALAGKLPPGADPRLLHFLERCSFDKALAHLDTEHR